MSFKSGNDWPIFLRVSIDSLERERGLKRTMLLDESKVKGDG
jgi:hypothetical protein